jgi:hypothetical protein
MSGHSADQGKRTSDIAISRTHFMNDSTGGLSVRFFKNTISAEIRVQQTLAAKPSKQPDER